MSDVDPALEQKYYEFLVRTDHPVFRRDFSTTVDGSSPFNVILNRILARQMARLRGALESLQRNSFANTVDAESIEQWEQTHFGTTYPNLSIALRVAQLMDKLNHRPTMAVSSVIRAAQRITGKTPIVIRNIYYGGWVLDQAALGIDTAFSGTNQANFAQTYYVCFASPITTSQRKSLDKELTRIEKGGSVHFIFSPAQIWQLDLSRLDIETVLG